ncbi:sigma-54-dependent Fis family transcriptional regulator [Paenactinomyces guangxiensis]|nr:sigma-54-dependent Fis family transcriptional regulator [Paenactinomyces guangxiensis]
MDLSNIPPSLISSWKRSENFGVDPCHVNDDLLSGGELTERRERMKELLESSANILSQLYEPLRSHLFMLVLSDLDGYIVAKWGDPPFTDRARQVWLDIGANWREDIKGTNAIGTALSEQKPVSVRGEEHYCQENRFLTCYASPLFSSTGELLGILDVSGDARLHHSHTLGMVVAAAHACQTQLLLRRTEQELVLHLQELNAITERTPQPLISVNADGIITRINREAAGLLRLPQTKCIGQPLSRWFGQKNTQKILSSQNSTSLHLNVKSDLQPGKQQSWLIQPVMDHRKKIFRVLLSPGKPLHTIKQETATPCSVPGKNPDPSGSGSFCHCPETAKIYQFARRVAKTDSSILICGETGTGKDVLAREIHRASGRKGSFIAINCGAIPETLIESELFGYEKGAFTGARTEGRKGKFEAAAKGTLFLDEIGEMPLTSQASLLRVLEDKTVTRIGSNRPIHTDVRILAATNKQLSQEVAKGRFRADLYYRLREIEILLPPLRERSDLYQLAEYFLEQVVQELGDVSLSFHPNTCKQLSQYDWPGNIRELRQVIRQAAYHACFSRESPVITKDDLSLTQTLCQPLQPHHSQGILNDYEEEAIARTIRATGGNLTATARLLGIGRTTLYRKLSQYPRLKQLKEQFKTE